MFEQILLFLAGLQVSTYYQNTILWPEQPTHQKMKKLQKPCKKKDAERKFFFDK